MEITSQSYAISQASRVEVLGWHQITTEDKADLEEFLSTGTLLSKLMGKGEAQARRDLMELRGDEVEVDV